jgi:AcrR family transcriptional regulator
MPRRADVQLEGRILDAAYGLWRRRGRPGVTMRAVARAAGTTTPTLYERFRDKDDLLRLLQQRARHNLYSVVKSSPTAADAFRKALDYFEAHPHEFQLITEDWATVFAQKEPMPSFELLKEHLAHELGGKRNDHTSLALAIVALLNGTATLLHAADIHDKIYLHFRQACLAACETLIRTPQIKKHPRKSRRDRKVAGRDVR